MDETSLTAWDVLQETAFQRILTALEVYDRIVAVGPTGMGKTKIMRMILQRLPGRKIIYTHRKSLFVQTKRSMEHNPEKPGSYIQHGCRAAGYKDDYRPDAPVQLAMIPSERSAIHGGKREMFQADYVLIDEAHANTDEFTKWLVEQHTAQGAKVIGLTATPLGLSQPMYQTIVEMSKLSQLRKVGGVLYADVYAPDEVDVSDVSKVSVDGEFIQKALGKKFAIQQVVGRVFQWWQKLNPEGRPALGFAPGVEESRWFADQFVSRGVRAAHIDGESIYLGEKRSDGTRVLLPSNTRNRDMVKSMSKSGEVRIVWNRFVMREGVDWPHLYHGIFATAFATEEAWVQSVGRILRADPECPEMKRVLITDHGGNVWRPSLGSPNIDRDWTLGDTNNSRAAKAKKDVLDGKTKEPVNCPTCRRPIDWYLWQKNGSRCVFCGDSFTKTCRWVQQTNGQLLPVDEQVTKPKDVKRSITEGMAAITSLYFRAKNVKSKRGMNFRQVMGMFHKEFGGTHRIIMDERTLQTKLLDKQTGESQVLGMMPPVGSALWHQAVRDVHPSKLQGTFRSDPDNAGDAKSKRVASDRRQSQRTLPGCETTDS